MIDRVFFLTWFFFTFGNSLNNTERFKVRIEAHLFWSVCAYMYVYCTNLGGLHFVACAAAPACEVGQDFTFLAVQTRLHLTPPLLSNYRCYITGNMDRSSEVSTHILPKWTEDRGRIQSVAVPLFHMIFQSTIQLNVGSMCWICFAIIVNYFKCNQVFILQYVYGLCIL